MPYDATTPPSRRGLSDDERARLRDLESRNPRSIDPWTLGELLGMRLRADTTDEPRLTRLLAAARAAKPTAKKSSRKSEDDQGSVWDDRWGGLR